MAAPIRSGVPGATAVIQPGTYRLGGLVARLTFPSDRLVYTASAYAGSAFASAANLVATVYSDSAGTTLADVQNADGTANATATFTVDTTSRLPLFLGPASGTDTLYVKVGTGAVTPIYAVTSGDISAAVGTEVTNRTAADAAHVAASDPHGDRAAATAAIAAQHATDNSTYVAASATDSGGRVYTLHLDATNPPSTGTRGLVISRSARLLPVGIRFEDTPGVDVAEMGLDASTNEFIIYDDVVTGDILRFAQGGIGILGPGIGSPAGSGWRLQIVSGDATDTAINGLFKFESRVGWTGANHLLGHDDALGADVWNISKSGLAAFGTTTANTFSGDVYLVAKSGISVWSNTAGKDAFIALNQQNGANATTWMMGSAQAAGTYYVKENATQNWVIQLQKGAISAGLLVNSFGTAVSASGKQLGFFGSGKMAALQSVTGALSTVTDANAKAVLTSILSALAAYNLVTNSTT